MSRAKYKVTIFSWKDNQPGLKKGHAHFMLSKTFFQDNKIADLNQNECLFYVNLLCIAGQMMQDSFEIHSKLMPNLLRISDKSMANCLEKLRSNQLLSYEKVAPNRIEKKVIEENGIETKAQPKKKLAKSADAESLPDAKNASHLIAHYCDRWKIAYRVESNPVIQPKDAKTMKGLLENIGYEKSLVIITNYLRMGDNWFVTKRHDIPTMMANLNSITQFGETGKIVTRSEINQLDKNISSQNLIDSLRKGEI